MRVLASTILLFGGIARAEGDLPKGAWPGVGLEELRGLPECTLDDPPTRIGHEITCRPPVLPRRAHYSLGVAWSTGLALDDSVHGVHALAVSADWWLARSLGIGAHLAVASTSAMDTTLSAIALARYRWFTDEADRDAVAFAAGAGRRGDSTVVRAALSRETGYMFGESDAVTWAWELGVERDLDLRATTITGGIRAGIERGIREPKNLHERDRDPPVRSALAGELRGSPSFGMGASLELGLGRFAQWRTTLLWNANYDTETGAHGLAATWAAIAGPRVWFAPNASMVPYVDAQGGPAAIDGAFGVLVEAELGIAVQLFCQTRLDLGARVQTEVLDGLDVKTGFFMLRVAHGTALRQDSACTDDDDTPIAR